MNNGSNFSTYTHNSWEVQADHNENVNSISGGPGNDVLIGTSGPDVIRGGPGNNTIFGLGGDDVLFSYAAGQDTIHGGDGNDLIYSLQSNDNDLLFGDAGADTFRFDLFTSAQQVGYVPGTSATIMEFQTGVDTIHLNLGGISTNDQNLYWLGAGEFTGANRLEATYANGVLQFDYNGDHIPDLIVNVPAPIFPTDITFTHDRWGY